MSGVHTVLWYTVVLSGYAWLLGMILEVVLWFIKRPERKAERELEERRLNTQEMGRRALSIIALELRRLNNLIEKDKRSEEGE